MPKLQGRFPLFTSYYGVWRDFLLKAIRSELDCLLWSHRLETVVHLFCDCPHLQPDTSYQMLLSLCLFRLLLSFNFKEWMADAWTSLFSVSRYFYQVVDNYLEFVEESKWQTLETSTFACCNEHGLVWKFLPS